MGQNEEERAMAGVFQSKWRRSFRCYTNRTSWHFSLAL